MKIHAVRIFLILITLLPLVVFGQVTGSRTCRVIFLGAADTDAATLHLYDVTASRKVALPRLNLSKIYTRQKLAIKAQSKVILDPPATGQQDYNVNLNFRIVGEDVFYPLCETRWVHNPDNRTLLFILNESGSRAPRILGFPDHREKKNP